MLWLESVGSQGLQNLKKTMRPTFYLVHLTYFIVVILISSMVVYVSSSTDSRIRYIDALYVTTSATCGVGLYSIDLGTDLSGFQQSVLFVDMFIGDLTIISVSVVWIRRYYFAKKIKDLLQHSKAARQVAEDVEAESQRGGNLDTTHVDGSSRSSSSHSSSTSAQGSAASRHHPERTRLLSATSDDDRDSAPATDYGSFAALRHASTYKRLFHHESGSKPKQEQHHSYLSFEPKLDHKGHFQSLTNEQERELGGIEYRALTTLTWLLPIYATFWIALVMLVVTTYVAHTSVGEAIQHAQPGHLHAAWWAIFASLSAYTNTGLNLLNASMVPLNDNYLILVFTGCAILVGNTFYPVLLRLAIWTISKLVPTESKLHHSCSFLLHHPRRCYLFLFPSKNTWILLGAQTAITLTAWLLWIVLQLDHQPIVDQFPPGQRAIVGLYQSVSLRAAGFYITDMAKITPALQVFYMVVMYSSVFPILLSLRTSNVYEERSLGQPSLASADQDPKKAESPPSSRLGEHFRQQLSSDIWWLVLFLFLICIVERHGLVTAAPGFSVFSVIFEVVSAYGTVGLSLGVPYDTYSFSGAWHTPSKLLLMAVMIRGRHRILPNAVDHAVLLPGEELMEKLDDDHESGQERRVDEAVIRHDEEGGQVEHEEEGGGGVQDPE